MRSGSRAAQSGFIGLALLLGLAVFAGMAGFGAETWHIAARRRAERELLFVGNEYRLAIAQYYENSPGTVKRYPASLADLLDDSRFLQKRRHLRRLYSDPMNPGADWQLVMAPQGGIMGVRSGSEEKPLKRSRFRLRDRAFEDARDYSEWVFVYAPLKP